MKIRIRFENNERFIVIFFLKFMNFGIFIYFMVVEFCIVVLVLVINDVSKC